MRVSLKQGVCITFLLLLFTLGAAAQTTVNLNVTDQDAIAWANGTYQVQIYGQSQGYNASGTLIVPANGSLDASGNATILLYPNANIAPALSQYKFTVCSGTSPVVCNTTLQTVSTSSPQSMLIAPPGLRLAVTSPQIVIAAYNQGEVTGATPGFQYTNVTTSISYICTANPCSTNWTAIGTPSSFSFSTLSGGTNTTAAMVVGTGASLATSGSGSINSTQLLGSTWAAPAAIGGTTPASGNFTLLTLGSASIDTGLSRTAAGVVAVGNGTASNNSGRLDAGFVTASNGLAGGVGLNYRQSGVLTGNTGLYAWTNGTHSAGIIDTGISRTAAGTIALGNGTASDASGTLNLSALTASGNISSNTTSTATSGANFNSPSRIFTGSYWNGTAAAADTWTWNNVLGTGANPTSTLTLAHAGSTGRQIVTIGTSANNVLALGQNTTSGSYNTVSLNGNMTGTGFMGLEGGNSGDSNLYYNATTSGDHIFENNGAQLFRINGFAAILVGASGTCGTKCAAVTTNTASNTDLAGQLTLSAGTASYTFQNGTTRTSAPICVATDTTAANAVKVATTTTTLTITGTSTDVINYICVARN